MRNQNILFAFYILVASAIVVLTLWELMSTKLIDAVSYCYWSDSDGIMELGQGEWDESMLIPSRCIFFHKTTCSQPSLTVREACAIESAALMNHDLNVFVLFLASNQFSETTRKLANILATYDNVYIRRVRLSTYVGETPMEDWFNINIDQLLKNRKWMHERLYDYIRMVTLWKFGGVTLNFNGVVQTKLDELGTFAGVQGDDNNMNVEMLGVDTSTDYGKKFVDTYFDVIKYMGAHDYVENDIVKIINITISQLCRTQTIFEDGCRQFKYYPLEKFYPISFMLERYYSNQFGQEELTNVIKDTIIMKYPKTVYDPDILTHTVKRAIYIMVAKKYCPKIYSLNML